jgi:hypothetical protein
LPTLGLARPDEVLDFAISSVRLESMNRTMTTSNDENNMTTIEAVSMEQLQIGEEIFHKLADTFTATVRVQDVDLILQAMKLDINEFDLMLMKSQLTEKETYYLSFADITELAVFLANLQFQRKEVEVL